MVADLPLRFLQGYDFIRGLNWRLRRIGISYGTQAIQFR